MHYAARLVPSDYKWVVLKHCRIAATGLGCVTEFPDGAVTSNWPPQDDAFNRIAQACGFSDTIAYIRHHDLAHSFLAEKFFNRPSPILWSAAHSIPLDSTAALYEERMVFHWQRFAQGFRTPVEDDWPEGLAEFELLWLQLARGASL